MENLTRINLSDNADIRPIDSNFTKVKNAVDNVENGVTNETSRATQAENAITANVATNTANILTHSNQIAALQTSVGTHTNQIADLQENLADFIGTFDTKADLDAYAGDVSNNDYAVVLSDETHLNQCWRYVYKESTTSWVEQYMVNEEPMTQAQLNALNSGINANKVAQIDTNATNIANKQDTLISGTNVKTINNESILGSGNIEIQGGGGNTIIETTYANLVALVNNSQLVVGQRYKITDYQTTVAGFNNLWADRAISAGHQFDIIVEAVETNKLSHKAKASKHSGDTYFNNSNLDNWELYYDIENNYNKYNWADATNGKGVIYYMKDDFNRIFFA